MKTFILALSLILIPVASHAAVTMSSLQLNDLQGLLPAFWLDHSGFEVEDEVKLDLSIPQTPMLPLLPLYGEGGFGKKTYVGGVIEEKYLTSLGRGEQSQVFQKIKNMIGPEGMRFRAVQADGKIFAIRSDYQIIYSRGTSIGLELSFGNSKTVNLGESTVYGMKLDFGAPFRVNPERGFNLVGNLQGIIDDWSVGLKPDETRLIIDQSVAIAPALISYMMEKPLAMVNDQGEALELIPATKNSELSDEAKSVTGVNGNFSKELTSIKKNISKNLKKEITWRETVKPQVSAEKIVNRQSTNEFIQNICDRLAMTYEVPAEIWPRCRVSATLAPNAWAYPGGDIFISAGMLGILSDVDSVALVLGHEIGHVMGRHTSKQALARKSYDYAATIVSTVVNLGITGFALGGGWGVLGNVNFISWYPQAMAVSVGGAYLAQQGSRIASFAPVAGLMLMSREYETEADHIGQEVAFASGAELNSMNNGWEEFVNFLDSNFPQELGIKEKIMSDHPDSQKRLKNFEKRLNDLSERLSDLNQQNLFDEAINKDYKKIHQSFKPYSNAYGKALREKLSKIQEGKSDIKKERKLQHFVHTLVGPQSRCVRHALGAQ